MEIINEKISITLGDGSKWELPYNPAPYNVDFNVSEFRFLQTEGAYIDRAKIGVRKFDVILYFLDKENHLNDYKRFEDSCRDSRYWIVNHPYNGEMNMQPLSIEFNPTPLHTTATVSLAETLTKEGILIQADFKSNVENKSQELNEAIQEGANDENLNQTDMNSLTESADTLSSNLTDKIDFQNISSEYKTELNKLKNQASNALDLTRSIQAQLMMPINFINDIKDTVLFIEMQFNSIQNVIESSVKAYEILGASIFSSLAIGATPTNEKTYNNTNDIDESVGAITRIYNSYVDSIQTRQSMNGYVMNYELYYNIHDLFIFTINHLYDIAVDAPLVVIDVTQHDTNPLIISHNYGMSIEDLFLLNNWSVRQSTFIEKDTSFKYYIR